MREDIAPSWLLNTKLNDHTSLFVDDEIASTKFTRVYSCKCGFDEIVAGDVTCEEYSCPRCHNSLFFDVEDIKKDAEAFNLTSLTKLVIGKNPIAELPKEIGNLINLEDLYIFRTKIKELPKEIGNLIKLDEVTMYGNQFSSLPKEIGNLVNLRFLSLKSNNLTTLPEEMNKLAKLEIISLDDNKFEDIPSVIKKLMNPLNQAKRADLKVNI